MAVIAFGGTVAAADGDSVVDALDCETVDHRPRRESLDFRGQRTVLRTTGCFRNNAPVAFLHEYVVAPAIEPLVEPDHPEGSGVTVLGDDWRLDLVGVLSEDLALAERLAAITGGEVAKRLSPLFCTVIHPVPDQQAASGRW